MNGDSSSRAVFLSYASQDAEAVARIAAALRTAGVEVWFDQDELVGGDAWDAKIRKQIAECALFVPVISAATQARHEGYFRLEWKLAAQRTHMIADGTPFLLPVVVDATRDLGALVPAEFKAVQWTRLGGGEMDVAFCARVQGVLAGVSAAGPTALLAPADPRTGAVLARCVKGSQGKRWAAVAAVGLVALALAVWRPWGGKPRAIPATAASADAPISSSPEVAESMARVWKIVDNPGRGRSDLEAAEELCKRAAAMEPTNPRILATWSHVDGWLILLRLDFSAARREAGRARARRALQLAPTAFETRLAWASFQVFDPGHVAPENAPEIESSLRALLRERPGEPHALLALGFLQRFTGEFPASRQTFEELARNPDHAAAGWCEIAYMHASARQFEAAETAVDASLARQPFFWNLSLKVQLALEWHGDLDAAGASFERVPREALREDHGFDLAMTVHQMRRDGAAMLRVLENTPRDWVGGMTPGPKAAYAATAYRFLGRDQAAAVERTAALRLVEKRLAETPNSRELLLWKGGLLAEQGEEVEAQRMLQLAQEMSGGNDIGALLLRLSLRRFDEAIATLEAWERDPGTTFLTITAAFVRHYWILDPLRSHPRFQALQARLDADPRFSPKAAKAQPPEKSAAVAAPADKSVAVLAFANLSDDRDNEYFSDGIADELLTVLQKIPGLRVAARTSAFSFKGKGATAKEVGEKLGMAHVVDGSVQKSGKRVKITARLSRAATNEEVWSESFGPLELTDIFATQSEIAQKIVAKLHGQLTGGTATTGSASAVAAQAEIKAQVQSATKGGTKKSEAHQLYLQGRFLATRSVSADVARGIDYYEQAVKLDPNFVLAWSALARARLWQVSWEPLNPARAQQARIAAERALAIDADMADAHSVLSQIMLRYSYEWRAAREASAHALALAPTDAAIITDAAATEQALGSLERSVELARRAVALDPVSVDTRFYLTMSYLFIGRLVEAEAETRRMIELSANGIFSYGILSSIHLLQGRPAEALAAAQKEPEKMYRLQTLSAAHHALGQTRESDAALEEMIRDFNEVGPYPIAWVYALRNDRDKAFEWLERSYQLRDSGISWVRGDTLLKPLHSDPRWPAFLRKIGLADDQLK